MSSNWSHVPSSVIMIWCFSERYSHIRSRREIRQSMWAESFSLFLQKIFSWQRDLVVLSWFSFLEYPLFDKILYLSQVIFHLLHEKSLFPQTFIVVLFHYESEDMIFIAWARLRKNVHWTLQPYHILSFVVYRLWVLVQFHPLHTVPDVFFDR